MFREALTVPTGAGGEGRGPGRYRHGWKWEERGRVSAEQGRVEVGVQCQRETKPFSFLSLQLGEGCPAQPGSWGTEGTRKSNPGCGSWLGSRRPAACVRVNLQHYRETDALCLPTGRSSREQSESLLPTTLLGLLFSPLKVTSCFALDPGKVWPPA